MLSVETFFNRLLILSKNKNIIFDHYRQDFNFFIKIINPANFKAMNIFHSAFKNEVDIDIDINIYCKIFLKFKN